MAINSIPDVSASALTRICESDAVADGEVLRVEIEGLPALAVYNVEGEYFVTDDTCSHGDASLADGFLEGTEIECPWHSGKFCIRTGRALTFPAVEPIRVYPVTLEGTSLLIPKPEKPSSSRSCLGNCHVTESEATR
jgi:nitrite reductase/ring-hydroxylating ferredoxin subunit